MRRYQIGWLEGFVLLLNLMSFSYRDIDRLSRAYCRVPRAPGRRRRGYYRHIETPLELGRSIRERTLRMVLRMDFSSALAAGV